MILKELLEHRTHCFIHGSEMQPFMCSDNGEHVALNKRGLSVYLRHPRHYSKLGHIGLTFNWNGIYDRESDCNSDDWKRNHSLRIYMICDECRRHPIYKSRSLGLTLANIKINQHYYIFTLKGNKSNYDGVLIAESIKYNSNDKFYHVDADLTNNSASLGVGSCKPSIKIEEILNDFRTYEAPVIDMKKVTGLDKLVDKMKLYTLFS